MNAFMLSSGAISILSLPGMVPASYQVSAGLSGKVVVWTKVRFRYHLPAYCWCIWRIKSSPDRGVGWFPSSRAGITRANSRTQPPEIEPFLGGRWLYVNTRLGVSSISRAFENPTTEALSHRPYLATPVSPG